MAKRTGRTWALIIFTIAMAILCLSCGSGTENASGGQTSSASDNGALSYNWQLLAPLGSGGFPASPGSYDRPLWEPGKFPLTLFPVSAFNNELWMTGQTASWSSSDGLNWTKHDKADWGERIWEAWAYFDHRLWMFGGMKYADRIVQNDIWSSADGVSWQKVGNAEWSPRKSETVVVFRDKLWLFGGADQVKQDFSTVHALNDVWSSDDGLHWTQVTAAAPWAPRDDPKVVIFNDALYLLGGEGYADVWRSTDGANWTPLAAEAPWKVRQGYIAIVFDDKMWLYAGWTGVPTNALNDVWYSADGSNWVRQTEHAPWGPRSPRSVVFQGKLWIFSGKHTGAADSWGGDIWAMSAIPQRR